MKRHQRGKPSERQVASRRRNWHIFKLRGLWHNAYPMRGDFLTCYRAAIDAQLREMGAEPEGERLDRLRAERDRYERFRSQVVGNFTVY